jgi:hypothetical protein
MSLPRLRMIRVAHFHNNIRGPQVLVVLVCRLQNLGCSLGLLAPSFI